MPRQKSKAPTEVMNQVICLRVTEAEAEQINANAEAAGCRSISDYIRSRCICENGSGSDMDTTAKSILKK